VTGTPIRVLVVDHHRTFAELLGAALDAQPALTYLGHAGTGPDARRLIDDLRPDVVLTEVTLPGYDGIAATAALRDTHPQTRVVVLTARTEPALVGRATAAGAAGFLTKTGALGDVLNAVRNAHAGGMTVSSHLLAGLLKRAPDPHARTDVLTLREHDVLQLMGGGSDARSIARQLGISVHTCRGHVKNVLTKLDAHSQLEAVAVATRRGLLTRD
jgi:DNA-binding NarL/FixJ family response regulator